MTKYIILLLLFFVVGCNISPVDPSVEYWHQRAQEDVPELKRIIQEGDIIFRLSQTQVAGGLIDFSKEIAKATDSSFSHAVLVYKKTTDGIILADVTPRGITRKYLIDWYTEGTKHLAIKRLKLEHRYLIPMVLNEMKKAIDADYVYDDKFVPDDDRFYCTELVDECFRSIGHPLAPRVRIKDWPNYNLLIAGGCVFWGVSSDTFVVIAGNDQIGLFSSPMLEAVLDRRPN